MVSARFTPASDALRIRKKVIYVDDIAYNLIAIKKSLSACYEVYPADSVDKLFEILEKIKPDIIILDINMPNVNGYDAIKKLKSDDRYVGIPVIFLTGKSAKEDIVKGLSLVAADYIIKPVTSSKLIDCIENNIDIKKRFISINDNGDEDKPAVLVVDDVTSMLRSIQFALQDKYKVYMLSKAEDVLEFLRNKKPELILLDYLMPLLNGFDLLPMIRSLRGYQDTPIIIITTEGTLEHFNNAKTLGATDFIVKPFHDNELQDKIAGYLK